MPYEIKFEKKAFKFINKQPPKQKERILRAIYQLPDRGDIKAMAGSANYYRLRVGDYRVIYILDNGILLITVVDVGNRGDVYNSY